MVIVLLFSGASIVTPAMAADEPIAGIYSGSMHLVDGTVRDIPLALSLIVTNERVPTPNGMQNVIDGTFAVDEEGGPYVFTRVTYDIDNNRLDLKYMRPRTDSSPTAPGSFRLVGNFGPGNTIVGAVSSGVVGQIGTFTVTRNASLVSLPVRQKYIGKWVGIGHTVSGNHNYEVIVTLQPSGGQTTNPTNYEFDFTAGRVFGYTVNGDIGIGTFNQVVIDYLRRKIHAVSNDGTLSLDLTADPNNTSVSGAQYSSMYGLTTIFKSLVKVY